MLINKGNPLLMGCNQYKDGYNFSCEAECDNAVLLIFDAHMRLKERIELDNSMKCGNIFSVYLSGKKLDKCFYCYEIDISDFHCYCMIRNRFSICRVKIVISF